MVAEMPLRPAETASAEFWGWFDVEPNTEINYASMAHVTPPTLEESKIRVTPGAVTGSGKRRPPSAASRREVLNRQRYRCLYCENRFGDVVRRDGKLVSLHLNWDHFIPYAYGLTNAGSNWVAACHVCNSLKSAKVFDSVAEAQVFIRQQWGIKGYNLQPLLAVDQIQPSADAEVEATDTEAARLSRYQSVPLDIAEVAEKISRRLEGRTGLVPRREAIPPGSSPHAARALAALVAAGHVFRRSVGGGRTAFASSVPYRAPADAPRAQAKPRPGQLPCPACRALELKPCVDKHGVWRPAGRVCPARRDYALQFAAKPYSMKEPR